MKLRKRLSALIVSAALLLTALPAIAPATASAATTMGSIVLTIDSPTMTVNGTSKAIDAEGSKPTLDAGGYTMLPLRGVVEAMGGSLTWDAANRIVTMVKDGQTIKVPIGSTKLTVDGVQKDMLANNGTYKAAYINKSGRTLVHVRALQAFNNTTCTWNQATKQITVTYPTNTPVVSSKNYRVDLINQSGADINALYYGQSGTYSYSKNVLTSTLKKNGTASFYISVPDNATTRLYDFYTEGVGTKFFNGLNLTGVNAYVTVVLKENGKFEQANDKTITVSSGDTALKVENNSKLDIEKLYMSKDSSFSSSEIIWDETIDAGDDETIDIDLDSTKTWYFQVVDEDGDKYSSGKVTFSSSTVKSATLTFSSSKKLSLKGSSSGDSTITFKNESGDDITAIYMAGSKSELDDADDLLDSTLKDGKSVEIDMDLESDTSWYITVEFDEYSDIEEYSLSFDYKDPASATLTITKKAVDITKEKKTSSRGELSVAFVNTSGTDIVEAYLVDDVKDFDVSDYDDLLDGDGLDDGDYIVVDEAADSETYDLVLYYKNSEDNEDAYESFEVDFEDADSYAAVLVDDDDEFSGETYTDDDDEIILALENNTGVDMENIDMTSDESDDDDVKVYGALDNDEIVFVPFDRADFEATDLIFDVDFEGDDSYTYDWDSADDYSVFTYVEFTDDEDDEADISDIDEI